MHIEKIRIENLPPLEYEVNLDCDKHVNLFIGPNASGKSSILQAINGVNSHEEPIYWEEGIKIDSYGYSIHEDDPRSGMCFWLYPSYDWSRDRSEVTPDAVPILYIPATRVNLRGRDIYHFNKIMDSVEDDEVDDPMKALFDTNSGIFYGQYVEMAIDSLRESMNPTPPDPTVRRADWEPTINRSQQNQLRKALEVGYACAKSICPEVMYDNMPHAYTELKDQVDDEDFYERFVHYGMGIGTTDNILGEPLYAGALSSGTQGTLLWVYALALKMASHYGWSEGWEKKPAILLIDEIENHLHPTWQRRVIPALLKHFPRLQIFATTHSPFMVAGLKAGQVHLLKRNEKGTITASTNERDVIGWTADEILRTMMGVDEPTDQLTVCRANRLRQLREKETLTPEEETELNELRRQVNKDLLSKGGPLEVERERYADLMRDFLRSQQSDLTQDGG